jgi:hypothetical protein
MPTDSDYWFCPNCERERTGDDMTDDNRCGVCSVECIHIAECQECSKSSGSDMPVYHAMPECKAEA